MEREREAVKPVRTICLLPVQHERDAEEDRYVTPAIHMMQSLLREAPWACSAAAVDVLTGNSVDGPYARLNAVLGGVHRV